MSLDINSPLRITATPNAQAVLHGPYYRRLSINIKHPKKNSSLYQESCFDSLLWKRSVWRCDGRVYPSTIAGRKTILAQHRRFDIILGTGVSLLRQGRIMDGALVNHSFMLPTSRLRFLHNSLEPRSDLMNAPFPVSVSAPVPENSHLPYPPIPGLPTWLSFNWWYILRRTATMDASEEMCRTRSGGNIRFFGPLKNFWELFIDCQKLACISSLFFRIIPLD